MAGAQLCRVLGGEHQAWRPWDALWDFPYGEKGDLDQTIQHNSFLGRKGGDEICSAQARGKSCVVSKLWSGRMDDAAGSCPPASIALCRHRQRGGVS